MDNSLEINNKIQYLVQKYNNIKSIDERVNILQELINLNNNNYIFHYTLGKILYSELDDKKLCKIS